MPGGQEFGESLWFTVDALGRPEDSIFPNEYEDALADLGDRPYVIEASDMIVKAERLTKEGVLKWAKVWLEHEGFEVTGFEESTLEEFQDSNQHVREIAKAKEAVDQYRREQHDAQEDSSVTD